MIKYKTPYGFDTTKADFNVHWVTEKTSFNEQKATFATYGNDFQLDHTYGKFCLIVRLGPAGNRASVDPSGSAPA